MRIKRIVQAQVPNCHFCKEEGQKVPAVWHLTMRCKQACDAHKPRLEQLRDEHRELDQRHTEADHQTWMKL